MIITDIAPPVQILGGKNGRRERASIQVAAGPRTPEVVVFVPIGSHYVLGRTVAGDKFHCPVRCDYDAYIRVKLDFEIRRTQGRRIWLDLDHDNKSDVAEITAMEWSPTKGICARVRWSKVGQEELRAGHRRKISPTLVVAPDDGQISGLHLTDSIGALVNASAFQNAPDIFQELT